MFYYGGYGYYGSGYMIGTLLVILAAILGFYAQYKVQATYRQYSKVPSRCNKTGAQVAREILDSQGLYHIAVREISGTLTDHYNPGQNVINLSSGIYNSTSISAVSVAAHECGHAIQYKVGYSPIKMRNAILPVANMGQYLGWISIMIGLALGSTSLALIGVILMCAILLFQIITLPVEFNASNRGLEILKDRYLDSNEIGGSYKVLQAAALTYVAAMISTLMSILRIVLIIFGGSRRD